MDNEDIARRLRELEEEVRQRPPAPPAGPPGLPQSAPTTLSRPVVQGEPLQAVRHHDAPPLARLMRAFWQLSAPGKLVVAGGAALAGLFAIGVVMSLLQTIMIAATVGVVGWAAYHLFKPKQD